MNIGNIKYCDIANGTGVRTSVFVSGCTNNCKGCFNKEAQNFNFGVPYTKYIKEKILKSLEPDYITGITFLGGDPMEPKNQEGVWDILSAVKEKYPNKTVWLYTGFVYEKLIDNTSYNATPYTQKILDNIDIMVDGPFVQDLYSIDLLFRGSSNQRLINMAKTRQKNRIVLFRE